MGLYRYIYYQLGWDYIGQKEQNEIDRQKHLKYQMTEQIKKSNIKLKKTKKSGFTNIFINNRKTLKIVIPNKKRK